MATFAAVTKPAQYVQPQKGGKGLSIVNSKNQYIQPVAGGKSFSIVVAQNGYSYKVKHYR